MYILPTCIMYECHVYVWYAKKSEEGSRSPETRDMGGYEPPYGCWESNPKDPGPLKDLLTTDSTLQPSSMSVVLRQALSMYLWLYRIVWP